MFLGRLSSFLCYSELLYADRYPGEWPGVFSGLSPDAGNRVGMHLKRTRHTGETYAGRSSSRTWMVCITPLPLLFYSGGKKRHVSYIAGILSADTLPRCFHRRTSVSRHFSHADGLLLHWSSILNWHADR